jgi:hypothetical protein
MGCFEIVQCDLCKKRIMISRDKYEDNKKDKNYKIYCSRKECKKEQKARGLI